MSTNIEIKAKARCFEEQKKLAQAVSNTAKEILYQKDIFFNTSDGRLKLRIFSKDKGELIFYHRANTAGPKVSDYIISPTSSPPTLNLLLESLLGVKGIVEKTRHLFISGQTRIYFDQVKLLGEFIELEVVLRPEQSIEEGKMIAHKMMANLGIREADLVERAYLDLMGETKKNEVPYRNKNDELKFKVQNYERGECQRK